MPRRRALPAARPARPRAASRSRTPEEIAARAQRYDGLTPEKQRVFFETLAATASVTRAAKACGVSRQALYAYRNRPDVPAFREAWEVAMMCAIHTLSDAAFDRAIDGWEEPVFFKGEQIGTRRRYNDRLLIELLRARDPYGFASPADRRHFRNVRSFTTRPRLEGALDDLAREGEGTFRIAYDDDPGGPLEG